MFDVLITFILAVFATYRVARMVALEEGPGAIFEDMRNFYLTDDWIGRGIRCPLCLGFWFAAIPAGTIGMALGLPWWQFAGLHLAIAGGQAVLHDATEAE